MHQRLFSENPLAVKVLTRPKNYRNLQKRTFILIFHFFLRQIQLEKVIFNQIGDFGTAC